MSGHTNTILLCAGPVNFSNLPVGTTQSNAMLPVNGKPVIGWILDDLREKGILSAIIVIQEKDRRLADFLSWAYRTRFDIKLVPVSEGGTIVDSLCAGLKALDVHDSAVRIVLGDTLIADSYEGEQDFVYISAVHDSLDWCIVDYGDDGFVSAYHDKQQLQGGQFWALAGYYHLKDSALVLKSASASVKAGEANLSDVLWRYSRERSIKVSQANSWLDFGHIENFVEARRNLLKPRYFNNLKINPVLNTITKISKNDEKLEDELNWYLSLPDNLKVLTPRILTSQRVNGSLEVTQEYYGYPTLAELFLYGNLRQGVWLSILKQLLRIQNEFQKIDADINSEDLAHMYIHKTNDRMSKLALQDSFWKSALEQTTITYNSVTLRNYSQLQDQLVRLARKYSRNVRGCIVHGDFCFSNILFDVNNQIVRLIDPRGSFGSKGIFGDPRYDIAKLRHSISGLYDFMIADLFEIEQNEGGFFSHFLTDQSQSTVRDQFDQLILESGFVLDEIKFVEGLLFLSMPPLHADYPERQKIMYLTGLSLLNEVIK